MAAEDPGGVLNTWLTDPRVRDLTNPGRRRSWLLRISAVREGTINVVLQAMR